MNKVMALLMLICGVANAEEWVALRPPVLKQGDLPQILIDPASIEILPSGIRRAREKVDFLVHPIDVNAYSPKTIVSMIFVNEYDCEKIMTREESEEALLIDGSRLKRGSDKPALYSSANWYPRPSPAADPTVDYVCSWTPKK